MTTATSSPGVAWAKLISRFAAVPSRKPWSCSDHARVYGKRPSTKPSHSDVTSRNRIQPAARTAVRATRIARWLRTSSPPPTRSRALAASASFSMRSVSQRPTRAMKPQQQHVHDGGDRRDERRASQTLRVARLARLGDRALQRELGGVRGRIHRIGPRVRDVSGEQREHDLPIDGDHPARSRYPDRDRAGSAAREDVVDALGGVLHAPAGRQAEERRTEQHDRAVEDGEPGRRRARSRSFALRGRRSGRRLGGGRRRSAGAPVGGALAGAGAAARRDVRGRQRLREQRDGDRRTTASMPSRTRARAARAAAGDRPLMRPPAPPRRGGPRRRGC